MKIILIDFFSLFINSHELQENNKTNMVRNEINLIIYKEYL